VLIVLEGPDGGGKTSLASALKFAWESWPGSRAGRQATVLHFGPPEPPDRCPLEEYELPFSLSPLHEQALSQDHLVICDRLHLGDGVYARYQPSKKPRLSDAAMAHLELALASLGALKVMCLPPLSVIQERVAKDGDDFIDQADLPRIYAEYDAIMMKLGYLTFTHTLPVSQVARSLISRTWKLQELAEPLAAASAGTYTGALKPTVIFAGDRLGGSDATRASRPPFSRPFTPARGAASSKWLLDALIAATWHLPYGIMTPWNAGGGGASIGIVNASHPGVDVSHLAKLAPGARWVALGGEASSALSESGIDHRTAWHPQYARRFKHGQFREYAEQLAEEAGFTPPHVA
jgi:thymidylate kinase